jgi:hypothetical protein
MGPGAVSTGFQSFRVGITNPETNKLHWQTRVETGVRAMFACKPNEPTKRKLPSQPCLYSSHSAGKHGEAVSLRGNGDTCPTRASTNDREPGACWSGAWNGVSLDSASYCSLCSGGFIPPLLQFLPARHCFRGRRSGVPRILRPGFYRGRPPIFTLVLCTRALLTFCRLPVHTPNRSKPPPPPQIYCFLSQSCFKRAKGANRGSVAWVSHRHSS